MLTTQIAHYCNHLLATTVLYLTLVDPIQKLSNNFDHSITNEGDNFDKPKIRHFASFVSASSSNEPTQDYYEILNVKKDATKHEIHKAFRQLAKKYHPDKNKDKNAQDEFIKIFKAYETLSDEKKRKEYDERSKMPNFNSHYTNQNGWHQDQMNDFDLNDFFKQYEDQFLKHAQYFHKQHFKDHKQQHQDAHHNGHKHEHFSFHGVNLDDLFHDIDEDEYQSFDRVFDMTGHNHIHVGADNFHDGTFGDGASFFGTHFPLHDTLHQYQHSMHASSGGHHSSNNRQGSYSCQTITKQVNGMMMTQTSCM